MKIVLPLGHENSFQEFHFQCVLAVFDRFLVLVLFGRICFQAASFN